MKYLLGEPVFRAQMPDQFIAPAGQQAALCAGVISEGYDLHRVGNRLREEYLAILHCLRQQMKMDIVLVIAHQDDIDSDLAIMAKRLLGAQLAGFSPKTNHAVAAFPRDMCVALPNDVVLVNPHWVSEIRGPAMESGKAMLSVLGEGGAVIIAGKTAVCAERKISADGGSLPIDDDRFEPLRTAGLRVVKLPLFGAVDCSDGKHCNRIWSNDHIDRLCALVEGSDGKPHLILDCSAVVAQYNTPTASNIQPIFAPSSMAIIRRRCEVGGIVFRETPRLRVPYSINLHQFEDGRVIMTGGEPELQSLVESIVGAGKVFVTDIPIRYYPTWRLGGIRCLIGDAPTVLFKS